MPLIAPSFFDDLQRMRTPSRPFDPTMNFRPMIEQLMLSCRTFRYFAIAPQNLIKPGLLVRAIVVKRDTLMERRQYEVFIDPVVVQRSGSRLSYEGCANIYLMRRGRKLHTGVLVDRPTCITVEYRTPNGVKRRQTFRDLTPVRSKQPDFVGILCHEVDHLNGRLIADIARESLIRGLAAIIEARTAREKVIIAEALPSIIQREGDTYEFRHGTEFTVNDVPPVSPDAFFVSDRVWRWYAPESLRVPREGELLPVRSSSFFKYLLEV